MPCVAYCRMLKALKRCPGGLPLVLPSLSLSLFAGVQMVAMERGKYYVAGKLTGLNRPERDFFCKTPAETREDLPKGVDVVAFQCRNPIHRAHYEVWDWLFFRASRCGFSRTRRCRAAALFVTRACVGSSFTRATTVQ